MYMFRFLVQKHTRLYFCYGLKCFTRVDILSDLQSKFWAGRMKIKHQNDVEISSDVRRLQNGSELLTHITIFI